MKKFILYMLAALGAFFVLLLVFLFFSAKSLLLPKPVVVKDNTQLYIRLSHSVTDFPSTYSLAFSVKKKPTVWEIEKALSAAAKDKKITSALLHLDFPSLKWSQVYSLVKVIEEFKRSGKSIVCYSSSFGSLGRGLKPYTLANACSFVALQPLGEVAVSSIREEDIYGGQLLFFKNLFDKWKVKADFIKAGQYKSAPEPFTLSGFSDDSRKAMASLIKNYEESVLEMLNGSKSSKKFTKDFLANGPYTDLDAIKLKLVSKLSHNTFRLKNSLNVCDYFSFIQNSKSNVNKIVVVPLDGQITDDAESNSNEGGVITPGAVEHLVSVLKKRPEVKAVILSVNSPGGSALASEHIAHLIKQLKKDKKVLVHMRSYAASGGYYIAAPAHYIMATPFTLTGSIGVFIGKFVLGDALKDFGVSFDQVDKNSESYILSSLSAFSPRQRSYIRRSIARTYDQFLATVAEGRNLSKESVLRAAEGRVWTGMQAKELKLVDSMGTLNDAVAKAVELASEVKAYDVELYKVPKSWSGIFMDLVGNVSMIQSIFDQISSYARLLGGQHGEESSIKMYKKLD